MRACACVFPQDQASRSVPNGACGYGELSAEMYPGFALAGVALDSSVFKGNPLKGCGTCVEVKCHDEVSGSAKNAYAVMALGIE